MSEKKSKWKKLFKILMMVFLALIIICVSTGIYYAVKNKINIAKIEKRFKAYASKVPSPDSALISKVCVREGYTLYVNKYLSLILRIK